MSGRNLDAGGHIRREGSLGLIPSGTAVAGRSDLDAAILLRELPTAQDLDAAAGLAEELDQRHAVIDGTGLLLWPVSRILDPAERYDLGFFLACLCTPLLGEDVARMLPWYRPTRRLARDTNGDIAVFLAGAPERLASLAEGADPARLCRQVARKLVRTGFTLVMPRWGGWASSLEAWRRCSGATTRIRLMPWLMRPGLRRTPAVTRWWPWG